MLSVTIRPFFFFFFSSRRRHPSCGRDWSSDVCSSDLGLHQHHCDFQMFYVLNGWIRFVYEGQGEHTFHAGDCVLQPPSIVHNELDCSDDLEVLEIYSPAVHETARVEVRGELEASRAS